MNFFLFQFNKFRENPWRVFWAAVVALFLVGLIFTEISVCRITDYLYSSYLLGSPAHTSLLCRIF